MKRWILRERKVRKVYFKKKWGENNKMVFLCEK
jgi:hypothetical protein